MYCSIYGCLHQRKCWQSPPLFVCLYACHMWKSEAGLYVNVKLHFFHTLVIFWNCLQHKCVLQCMRWVPLCFTVDSARSLPSYYSLHLNPISSKHSSRYVPSLFNDFKKLCIYTCVMQSFIINFKTQMGSLSFIWLS